MGNVRVKDGRDRNFEVSTSKDAYTRAGQWKLLRYDGGHFENPQMREEIRRWLVAHL